MWPCVMYIMPLISKTCEYNKLCFPDPLLCLLMSLHLTNDFIKDYKTTVFWGPDIGSAVEGRLLLVIAVHMFSTLECISAGCLGLSYSSYNRYSGSKNILALDIAVTNTSNIYYHSGVFRT